MKRLEDAGVSKEFADGLVEAIDEHVHAHVDPVVQAHNQVVDAMTELLARVKSLEAACRE